MPAFPSVTVTSPIDSAGAASSSVIVPTRRAVGDRGVAAPLRLTVNVSSGSSSASRLTGTVNVCDVSPGAKVSVPLAAV